MKTQIEKNKETLWEEVERICQEPINLVAAERLILCMKAHKAICIACGEEEGHEHKEVYKGKSGAALTPEKAKKWVESMENEDGTHGPHWTLEQVKNVMELHGITCDPHKFWAAMNASYSDLCGFFKKYNINTLDAYIDYTRDFWFKDKDAVEDKVGAYYSSVVKH